MQANLTFLSNPIWSNAEQTRIDCKIKTSQFGEEVLPFTADKFDIEPHGRAIFADIVSGKHGTIADYVPVPELVQPTVNGAQTL